MDGTAPIVGAPSREKLMHALYEAAELEHNLMCTYLYAAFSLKDGEAEGLNAIEAAAVGRASLPDQKLAQRDRPRAVAPEPDGPLRIGGNLEIMSGTGRTVACVQMARLCRCGGSANKPFCDDTHKWIGFQSG